MKNSKSIFKSITFFFFECFPEEVIEGDKDLKGQNSRCDSRSCSGPDPGTLMVSDSAIQQSKNQGQISKHMDSGSYGMLKPSFHMESKKTSDPNFPLISTSSEHRLCRTEAKHFERHSASFWELSEEFAEDCLPFHE